MARTVLINRGAEIEVVDVNGTTRNLTTEWTGGLPDLGNDVVDVSAISDAAHRSLLGLQNANITLTFDYEDTGTTGSWSVLSGRLGEATARNVIWYPSGTASGKPKITLPLRLSGLQLSGNVGEKQTISANWALDGTRTVGTV